mmetsp:Transcript_10292/g.35826  ORF Transcript_10292/g.35826 Transcript_10292/m.35826 type:complete len:272 (+) Transcript_10292:845-1660(+)
MSAAQGPPALRPRRSDSESVPTSAPSRARVSPTALTPACSMASKHWSTGVAAGTHMHGEVASSSSCTVHPPTPPHSSRCSRRRPATLLIDTTSDTSPLGLKTPTLCTGLSGGTRLGHLRKARLTTSASDVDGAASRKSISLSPDQLTDMTLRCRKRCATRSSSPMASAGRMAGAPPPRPRRPSALASFTSVRTKSPTLSQPMTEYPGGRSGSPAGSSRGSGCTTTGALRMPCLESSDRASPAVRDVSKVTTNSPGSRRWCACRRLSRREER